MCDDGTCIFSEYFCDGTYELGHDVTYGSDCPDGSDEIPELCCSYHANSDYEESFGTYTLEFCDACENEGCEVNAEFGPMTPKTCDEY